MKRIPVWKNIVLILSLIVTIIIATLAWFYNDHRGLVTMDIEVGEASYIQISGDGGNNWSEELEIGIGVDQDFKEISGDGANFYEPVYEFVEDANGVIYTDIVSFQKVTDTTKFYEQTFEFKSDLTQNIYLDPDSFVVGLDDERTSYIDGAIRVAFFEVNENGDETLKCIWAPNSKTEYSSATNSFTKEGAVENYYYYQKSTMPVDVGNLAASDSNVVKIPAGGASGCGYDANSKYMWSCDGELPQNAPCLLKINVEDGADFGYNTMKIRVWLEGHDRECVSLLGRQKFTMNFQFHAEKGE